VGGNAKAEGVEERKNNDFRFFARILNLVNVAHFVNQFVYRFVGVHNGFAFSRCSAAVEIYGDIIGVVLYAGNRCAEIFFERGGIAFAV